MCKTGPDPIWMAWSSFGQMPLIWKQACVEKINWAWFWQNVQQCVQVWGNGYTHYCLTQYRVNPLIFMFYLGSWATENFPGSTSSPPLNLENVGNVVKHSKSVYTREQRHTKVIYYYYYHFQQWQSRTQHLFQDRSTHVLHEHDFRSAYNTRPRTHSACSQSAHFSTPRPTYWGGRRAWAGAQTWSSCCAARRRRRGWAAGAGRCAAGPRGRRGSVWSASRWCSALPAGRGRSE